MNKEQEEIRNYLIKIQENARQMREQNPQPPEPTPEQTPEEKQKAREDWEFMQLLKLLAFHDVVIVPDGEPADIHNVEEIDEFVRRKGLEHKAEILAQRKAEQERRNKQ